MKQPRAINAGGAIRDPDEEFVELWLRANTAEHRVRELEKIVEAYRSDAASLRVLEQAKPPRRDTLADIAEALGFLIIILVGFGLCAWAISFVGWGLMTLISWGIKGL
jgi:predicted TIM-barrel fold metal-dependent hydrolase